MDSIREFKNCIQNWRSTTIVVIVINVRGVGDNKGEKKLLIISGKCEFDQNVLALSNNYKTKYEQLLKAYNGRHCGMVLIKNMITKTKGDQYLKTQHYTIITKIVD
jgi:hypothetical protein